MSKTEDVRQFIVLYNSKKIQENTCPEAYELAEAEWYREKQKRMYKNYLSFQNARAQFLRVKKNRRILI